MKATPSTSLLLLVILHCHTHVARHAAEAWLVPCTTSTLVGRRSTIVVARRTFSSLRTSRIISTQDQEKNHASTTTTSALLARTTGSTRRDVMGGLWTTTTSAGAAAMLLTTLGTTVSSPDAAYAELDYSKIQDLLGADATSIYEPGPGKRPSYLTEPTGDFLENEKKAAAFRAANVQKQKTFVVQLDQMTNAPNDEQLLTTALDTMRRQVKKDGGLPTGITKEMIVKTCRRRKALKYWPTNVEIAYQDLLLEIAYQQSPNTDRDTNML